MGDHVARIISSKRESVPGPNLIERLGAEFVGTFCLVLTVSIAANTSSGMAPVGIGLILAAQIYTFGPVSGGFFNPAVTVAVLLSGRGKISLVDAGLYVFIQFVAGLIGGLIGYAAIDQSFYFDYDLTKDAGCSLTLEMFYTMMLCGTVLATGTSQDAPNQYFGFAIGMTVCGAAFTNGGFNQGSFNPAVTLGINVANNLNTDTESPSGGAWALFLFAPILGGVLAACIFRFVRSHEYEPKTFGKVLIRSD